MLIATHQILHAGVFCWRAIGELTGSKLGPGILYTSLKEKCTQLQNLIMHQPNPPRSQQLPLELTWLIRWRIETCCTFFVPWVAAIHHRKTLQSILSVSVIFSITSSIFLDELSCQWLLWNQIFTWLYWDLIFVCTFQMSSKMSPSSSTDHTSNLLNWAWEIFYWGR